MLGLPVARSGGHAEAQAPEQALVVPASFLNRYSVSPRESTRIFPRPVLARPTVAACPLAVFGGAGVPGAGLLLLLPPPAGGAARAAGGAGAGGGLGGFLLCS